MSYTIDDSVDRASDDLRVVKLCYEYASLCQRSRAGERLTRTERAQMRTLDEIFGGDPLRRRREHRRIATLMPATLRTGAVKHRGLLMNVSGGGMFVATDAEIPDGSAVQVRLGRPGAPRFVFPCVVRRRTREGNHPGVGLKLSDRPACVESWQSDDTAP